jgi:hypothetical protein
MRLLEKLNTPRAVVAVLAIFLVADGFLLYRYRADDEAARPNNGEKGGALQARTAEPTEAPPSGAVSTAEAAAYSPVTASAAEPEPTGATRSGAVSTAEAAAYSPVTAAPTYREPISEPQYGADLPASPQGATFYEWWWFTY